MSIGDAWSYKISSKGQVGNYLEGFAKDESKEIRSREIVDGSWSSFLLSPK
jgi:hypothetical protein